jgi:ankyrin repeat protein
VAQAFHAAVVAGSLDIVEAAVDTTLSGSSPTDALSPYSRLAALINSQDDLGRTPLMKACGLPSGKAVHSMVTLLIGGNADVTRLDFEGFSALHYAAATVDAADTLPLLVKGVPIDARSDFGETPAHR